MKFGKIAFSTSPKSWTKLFQTEIIIDKSDINFSKILESRHYVVGGLQSLPDTSSDSEVCCCFRVLVFKLIKTMFNEVATSTARNFGNSWLLNLHFTKILINLCPNIWFMKNSKHQQLLLWRAAKKQRFSFFLKSRYFVMAGSSINVGMFWETSVGFLKSVVLQLFQITANAMLIWISKVGKNSTGIKKWTGCFSFFHLDVICRTL